MRVSKNKIVKILKSLDFKISDVGASKLQVEVPTRRLDISIQEDLIEEIVGEIEDESEISDYPQVKMLVNLIRPEDYKKVNNHKFR